MKKRNREQIVELLRLVDRSLDEFRTVKEACENLGINRSSFYRWQKQIMSESVPLTSNPAIQSKRIEKLEDQVLALSYASRGNLKCPTQRRYLVQVLQQQQGWSQRRACRALNQNRATQRYKKKKKRSEELIELLTNQYPMYGGRKIAVIGNKMTGIKRETLEKNYHRKRHGKRKINKVVFHKAEAPEPKVNINKSWSCDLTESSLWNGKRLVWFAVLDEETRKCLCLEARGSWSSKRISQRLERIFEQEGKPDQLRVDNASFWRATDLNWLVSKTKVRLDQTKKASPWENAKIESFFASFHREFLKRFSLLSIKQANEAAQLYLELYNTQRPHISLGGQAPCKFEQRLRSGEVVASDGQKTEQDGSKR